ncbi:hypothetical protein I3760_10G154900 [Carya illinoinensis]|uniref:Alpha 1,4-glycosyltransferase domain-containing protein n=1 Tax=Carya illinoinensis TaxID=32201 RepID=A0A922D0D0_CARIL|nr:lactosylceramide 4-alpha-galactosyltransferase-like isoform X1 [Carya illinoinensis]XP_042947006.1 lactosylceramide 4-alpha-galactosyltransferase-like isoform X1 [Carya illinoinensis]KAG2686008.1 hypothetical protein I3760_10G154900 [Carya illinoinensis]KAG6620516.1 hypothetical protein I3842_Q064500 [Carya illinoinensis]KAG6693163.1 hypothetical protein I3842_10G153600 [Carya illinoinensis]
MVKKFTRKMFDYQVFILSRAKLSRILSKIITLAVLIFIIYTVCIVSEISHKSVAFYTNHKQIAGELGTHEGADQGRILESSTISPIKLRSIQEESDDDRVDDDKDHFPVPPFNVSEQERIEWLRKNIPKFEIFKSNNFTRRFHDRVLDFFNRDSCEVQFFMTWIAPAKWFGEREFLAMESLFKVHPRGCLMILSRSMDSARGHRILKPLLDRGLKVKAVTPDLAFLFKGTPAKTWFDGIRSGEKDPGEISLAQNLSNLLRLAVLFKYGGVYLDTDFIVIKPFTGLKNSIGAQSMDVESKKWTRLNNAILVFDMNHPLLFKFMEEFAYTFDGNKWGHNGPYLVSRVVERVRKRPGYNFRVLPPMAFYPADWIRIRKFFQKPKNQNDLRWVKAKLLQLNGETYGVHLWNKQTCRLTIQEGSVLGRLISDHCVICNKINSS